MRVIGVTGEMASGKTCFSSVLSRTLRCRTFDADKVVHSLYKTDATIIRAIKDASQKKSHQESINKQQLLSEIIEQPSLLKKIEQIVHPRLQEKLNTFIKLSRRQRTHTIILDIPLLAKIGADRICKSVVLLEPSIVARRSHLKKRCHNAIMLSTLQNQKALWKGIRKNKIIGVASGLSKCELYKYVHLICKQNIVENHSFEH